MSTFDAQTGFRAVDDFRIGEQVGREIHAAHRLREEAFADRVHAISVLPVALVADWYGEAPQQVRQMSEPVIFPPDFMISGMW
ncbi:MAG: hypothetical protein KIH63_005480 [Candidatus Saccharibacteria bacterium]|nr:hypothetical protein [Candidatus Saccharibacteria bacterium]